MKEPAQATKGPAHAPDSLLAPVQLLPLYFALLGSTAPFLALYFDHLGFSPARIGELVAIPMLMRCIAPNLWGWLGIAAANGC